MSQNTGRTPLIDVHTHVVPDTWRKALLGAGTPTRGELLICDGFVTPEWTLESYLKNREDLGIDCSIVSITAPGVGFLKGNSEAKNLARKLNEEMDAMIKLHPKKLGAFCVLPLPDVDAALEEIRVSPLERRHSMYQVTLES
jgi:6-methylsalicylate decarboxylase